MTWEIEDIVLYAVEKGSEMGGLFETLLYNTKTDSKMGAESTGNAGILMPRAWNIVLEPGDYSLDELLEEAGNGFLVTNNWYTRLQNYVEGAVLHDNQGCHSHYQGRRDSRRSQKVPHR